MKFIFLVFLQVYFFTSFFAQPSIVELSDNDKHSFVKIYLELKRSSINMDSLMEDITKNSNFDILRLREILKNQLVNKNILHTPQDSAMLLPLREISTMMKNVKQAKLEKLCKRENIALTTYEQILKEYRTNIYFQHALKPYFKSFIEKL